MEGIYQKSYATTSNKRSLPSKIFHVSSWTMNEFEFIDRITHDTPRSAGNLVLGVGDDCAIIEQGSKHQLITADSLIEEIHFKLAYLTPHDLGRRALNINFSDIAAMGGMPRYYIVCIALPAHFDIEHGMEIFNGMAEAAKAYNAILIGGDTVTSPSSLTLSITALGEIDAGKAILRSGCGHGDALYVTGTLGDSALGLECLRQGIHHSDSEMFIERYRNPSPRIAAGEWLAHTGMVTAMIDISDGLLADVSHLADSSKTGYEILIDSLPRSAGFNALSRKIDIHADEFALAGGDDYELAFTVARDGVQAFEKQLHAGNVPFEHAITRIGTITADMHDRRVLDAQGDEITIKRYGYEHLGGMK